MTKFLPTAGMAAACALALAACANTPVERVFSAEIGQMALEAQAHVTAEDHAAARVNLDAALDSDPSRYERFILLQMRGAANYRLGEIDAAIADWKEALAQRVATREEAGSLSVNIGQLMLMQGEVDEGASLLERWVEDHPDAGPTIFMLAQALAGDGQFRRALPYAEQARALASPAEDKHLALLAYLYNALGRSSDMEALRLEIERS